MKTYHSITFPKEKDHKRTVTVITLEMLLKAFRSFPVAPLGNQICGEIPLKELKPQINTLLMDILEQNHGQINQNGHC